MNTLPLNITIGSFDFGGGHNAQRDALKGLLEKDHNITTVNLFEDILFPLDISRRLAKSRLFKDKDWRYEKFYNRRLERDETRNFSTYLHLTQLGIRISAPMARRLVRQYLQKLEVPPDIWFSLIPNFNPILFQSIQDVYSHIPYATIPLDWSDLTSHQSFWFDEKMARNPFSFVISSNELLDHQAEEIGYPIDRRFQVVGNVLRPTFYTTPFGNKDAIRAARQSLNLDPDIPTVIIMSGGSGSLAAARVVERLNARFNKERTCLQTIVICGRSDALFASLQGVPACCPVYYTSEMPRHFLASDITIALKPGPGVLSESLHAQVPVITLCNEITMPQERPNAERIEKEKLGIVVSREEEIPDAVEAMIGDNGLKLQEYRGNVIGLDPNNADRETPRIMEEIVRSAAIARRQIPTPSRRGGKLSRLATPKNPRLAA